VKFDGFRTHLKLAGLLIYIIKFPLVWCSWLWHWIYWLWWWVSNMWNLHYRGGTSTFLNILNCFNTWDAGITYFSLQERKKLLQCSCCGKLVHSTCLMPPIGDIVPEEWSCHLCKEKTDEYLQARQAYIAELQKRYRI